MEFEKNVYELDIIKDKNYCNCNINTITNVNLLAKASNEIYSGEISKNCISKSTFFDKKIKKIIMKKCSGFINSDGIEEDDGEKTLGVLRARAHRGWCEAQCGRSEAEHR